MPTMPVSDELLATRYALIRSNTDTIQAITSILRYIDSTTPRVVETGRGRLAEHGRIASGRVIPAVEPNESPSSSSTTRTDVSGTTWTARSSTSSRPPSPIKRVMRRRMGVLPPSAHISHILKSDHNPDKDYRPEAVKILLNEARLIKKNVHPSCFMSPRRDDIYLWTAVIEGPPGTVYEGGTFFCKIHFSRCYPHVPPKMQFLTRIYHCNVSAQGEVSADILTKRWLSKKSILTVRSALMSLFYRCYPDKPVVDSISKEYRENRAQFNKTARTWTQRYAV
ncbi:Ubiquitin-conjugating enzyme E2-24 kDa, variant 2 [Parelaphostrongylus tenuis]|uniref:Ubiquitin-conjugating enzyme E2-24 kDa, variant 2 n=1 Tax=Parelaphostrongylus tenuis TaxID=148309 RepID=A0AAD5NC07_PARTN|nr:Ubiquitin-conjugating enzyme E2-24 kDa, variant 2 [Parelaphostrongylus tenuis]